MTPPHSVSMTANELVALAPCPFCDVVPVLDGSPRGKLGMVRCNNEDCSINPCTPVPSTKADAVKLWNTRVASAPAPAPDREEPMAWIVSSGNGYEYEMFRKIADVKRFERELHENGWDDIKVIPLYASLPSRAIEPKDAS